MTNDCSVEFSMCSSVGFGSYIAIDVFLCFYIYSFDFSFLDFVAMILPTIENET